MKLIKVESDKTWTVEPCSVGERAYRQHVLHCIEATSEYGVKRFLDYVNRYNQTEYGGVKPWHLLLACFSLDLHGDHWKIKITLTEASELNGASWLGLVEQSRVDNFYRKQEREFRDVLPRVLDFDPVAS